MNLPLILLHEEALRMTRPVFSAAPNGTKTVFIWDDSYFRQMNYSLKRLVFIYETLCEMPMDILRGEPLNVIKELAPSCVYIPSSNNPLVCSMMRELKRVAQVEVVEESPFVKIKKPTDFMRFFQYWKKAERTALMKNGGH